MEYLTSWVVVKIDGQEVLASQMAQFAEPGEMIEVTINEGTPDCREIQAEFVREIGTSRPQ